MYVHYNFHVEYTLNFIVRPKYFGLKEKRMSITHMYYLGTRIKSTRKKKLKITLSHI